VKASRLVPHPLRPGPLAWGATFVAIATVLGGFVFPWWWPAVPGLVVGFWKPDTRIRTFLAACAGGAVAWAAVALYYDAGNEGILSARIAPLFHLSGEGSLILLTAGVGGLTAGLGSMVGGSFRRFWRSLMLALAAEDVVIPPDEEKDIGR
jgi:hypothetical protein